MAREIDDSTGRPAVFVTGEPSWHRLTNTIAKAATSAEAAYKTALELAGVLPHAA